jgi:LAO/AO transport system kinase
MLDLGYASSVPGEPACRPRIVTTTATEGTGIDTLADALDAHINRLRSSGALATRRARLLRAETRARALALLGHRLDHLHEREQADRILAEVESRRLPPWSAARALVELAANGPGTVSG